MSMYDGLDLSRFRRVSSDKKSITLRHSKGHEIKIAHTALTPKMREKIDSLQGHEEPIKSYAEGTPDEPVSLNDGAPTLAPAAAPIDPQSPTPVTEPTIAPQVVAPQQPQAAPTPKPVNMPVAGEVTVEGRPTLDAAPPPPTPVQIAQQMTNEDIQFQQDLAKGMIRPKTYQDLFAEKSTLGKIGTFFGLLISGAGAGLAKQPNAVLEMMNKEIERDLEAQKQTKSNAANWYKLSLDHAMTQANVGLAGAQTVQTIGQTQLIPSQIALNKAQSGLAYANASLAATNSAKAKMMLSMIQDLQNQADTLPPGPQKDQFLQSLGQVQAAAATEIQTANLKTADAIQARNNLEAAATKRPAEDENYGVDLQKLTLLKQLAQVSASEGVPNRQGASPQDMAKADEEAAEVAQNRSAAKLYIEAFNDLSQQVAGGRLNRAEYGSQVKLLSGKIAKAMGNTSIEEADRIASAMFPNWDDFDGSREKKYENAMQMFESNESGAQTLKRLKLVKPFPYKGKAKSADPLEGRTANGGKLIRRNGKWEKNTQAKK